MNEQELQKRKLRASDEPLVITKTSDGFRIFSAANPTKFYLVQVVGDRMCCNCMDFEKHMADPTWQCKHVLAVAELKNGTGKGEEELEREAIQNEGTGNALPEGPAEFPPATRSESHLVIKRSLSPDGRIDSVSLEMDLELNGEPPSAIKARALKALQLEAEIASTFLASVQLQKELNGTAGSKNPSQPGVGPTQPVAAKMLSIGVMPGKWGPRYFINVDVSGRPAKLFGTQKQLAEHLTSVGYNFPVNAVTDGISLNIPCQVTTSQNGAYLNIERVFPAR